MLTSDVNCLFTPRSEENNGKKTEIIDQPRFHADTHSTSQKCPLISSLTPLFDSTNYLALFRSYQRAIIHCQTFSVARGERNAHFSVLAPRLLLFWCEICIVQFKIVNLAHSAALTYNITTLIFWRKRFRIDFDAVSKSWNRVDMKPLSCKLYLKSTVCEVG